MLNVMWPVIPVFLLLPLGILCIAIAAIGEFAHFEGHVWAFRIGIAGWLVLASWFSFNIFTLLL